MSPRGVRFLVGRPGPARPASRTDEKKGKSGSTHSAQGLTAGVAGGCWTAAALGASPCINASAVTIAARPARISFAHSIIDRRASTARSRYLSPSVTQSSGRRLRGPDPAARGLPRQRLTSRHRHAPHRHSHRLGRPPVRGVSLPRAVPVRRTIGRSGDGPQRQLPRADNRRERCVGLRVDDARQRLGVSRRAARARSGGDESPGRRAAARDGGLRRAWPSHRSLSRARARISARRRHGFWCSDPPDANSEAVHARRRERVRRRDSRRVRQGVRRQRL